MPRIDAADTLRYSAGRLTGEGTRELAVVVVSSPERSGLALGVEIGPTVVVVCVRVLARTGSGTVVETASGRRATDNDIVEPVSDAPVSRRDFFGFGRVVVATLVEE